MTKRDKLKRALEARGYREVQTASRKYIAMENRELLDDKRLFLGASGALRIGRVSSQTHAALETTRSKLLAEGEAIIKKEMTK